MDVMQDVNSHTIANAADSVDNKNLAAIHAFKEILDDKEDSAKQLRDSGTS
jgi:hypothetical protein